MFSGGGVACGKAGVGGDLAAGAGLAPSVSDELISDTHGDVKEQRGLFLDDGVPDLSLSHI